LGLLHPRPQRHHSHETHLQPHHHPQRRLGEGSSEELTRAQRVADGRRSFRENALPQKPPPKNPSAKTLPLRNARRSFPTSLSPNHASPWPARKVDFSFLC